MSAHDHEPHSCNCEHLVVRFCKHCQLVYCCRCHKEWVTKNTYYPWYYPYTYTIPCGSGTVRYDTLTGGNVTSTSTFLNDSSVAPCTHGE